MAAPAPNHHKPVVRRALLPDTYARFSLRTPSVIPAFCYRLFDQAHGFFSMLRQVRIKSLLPALLLLTLSLPQQVTAREVSLGVYDYPPFLGRNLMQGGVLEELSNAIFAQAGYATRRVSMPFARLVAASRIGEVDVIVGLWHTRERESHFLFSKNILLSTPVGFYKLRNRSASSLRDGNPGRHIIGMPRGYALPPGFSLKGRQLLALDDDYQALNMLSRGRIDRAIISRDLASYLFRTRPELSAGKLEFMEPALGVQHFYMAISRSRSDHQQLLRDIDKSFRRLHGLGTLQAIIRKHGFRVLEEQP